MRMESLWVFSLSRRYDTYRLRSSYSLLTMTTRRCFYRSKIYVFERRNVA